MADTRWLDDEEQRAWRAFVGMQRRLTAELNRQLQTASRMSLADYEVLVRLADAPDGRLRFLELQRDLDWEQSRLSHHLSRMQGRDLVRREHCGEDGRGAYVTLTGTGRQAITEAAPGHVDTVRRLFFDTLAPGDVETVHQLATGVLDRIDATGICRRPPESPGRR